MVRLGAAPRGTAGQVSRGSVRLGMVRRRQVWTGRFGVSGLGSIWFGGAWQAWWGEEGWVRQGLARLGRWAMDRRDKAPRGEARQVSQGLEWPGGARLLVVTDGLAGLARLRGVRCGQAGYLSAPQVSHGGASLAPTGMVPQARRGRALTGSAVPV